MDPETYALLKDFQGAIATGVSAFVGFTGVITTLIVNARATRRLARENREHDSRTVARAIASELRFHELILIGYIASFREGKPVMMMPPVTPTMDAYVSKLGLVPPDQISYVTAAYFVLKELNAKLQWIYTSDAKFDAMSEETQSRQALVAMERTLPAVQMAIAAIDPIPPPFKPLQGFDKPIMLPEEQSPAKSVGWAGALFRPRLQLEDVPLGIGHVHPGQPGSGRVR